MAGTKKQREVRFRVGDVVSVDYGTERAEATVIEDRGPLGVGGRRLYRIRFPGDPDAHVEPRETEVPAEELELVKAAAR